MTRLNLVVLYSKDIEGLKSFYEGIGLEFRAERHGDGPFHYAAGGDTVLEIYPTKSALIEKTAIGFEVDNLTQVVADLREYVSEGDMANEMVRLRDPDNRRVFLTEKRRE